MTKSIFPATVFLSASILTACAANGGSADKIEVYRQDGSRQCQGGGISPHQMRAQLGGIRVYAERKDQMRGVSFPAVCGGGTGSINVYTVGAGDKAAAEQRGFTILPPE